MAGILYLIPNTLGEEHREVQLATVLPHDTIQQASQLRYWIVENAKTARALLKAISTHAPLICPLQEMNMSEWRGPNKEHQQKNQAPDVKKLLKEMMKTKLCYVLQFEMSTNFKSLMWMVMGLRQKE